MKDRDWRLFWNYAFRSLKYAVLSTLLVPVIFLLMNSNFSSPDFWESFWFTNRIGLQLAVFFWICSTAIYGGAYIWNPPLLLRLKKSLGFQVAKGLAIMAVGLALTSLTEPYLSGNEFGWRSARVGMLIGGMTFLLVVLYVGYRETREYNLKLQSESTQASLNVLKNQMQPHFLFNSLNSLSELIEIDSRQAGAMTQKLADLYREILENSKQPFATLDSEMGIIQKYLELERLRYGERLSFSCDYPAEAGTAMVPSLILQTLVENAVKHGIGPSQEGGTVSVRVWNDSIGYRAQIQNTGAPLKAIAARGTGLANTRSRLDLLYGNRHRFEISKQPGGTRVEFWFSGVALVES